MSLYRTKEWWSTQCGSDEKFSNHSLLIVPSFMDTEKNIVIVSSHNGYIRVYNPSSQWNDDSKTPTGYQCTDLMIEIKVADCIIDIKIGKFVSGSQEKQLGILTPEKLIIYALVLTKDLTNEVDQCDFQLLYEHQLSRFPVSLIIGPFGGTVGRDFICIQYLDTTLHFYEQENYIFEQALNCQLLPGIVIYEPHHDVFISSSSDWVLECYRYQKLAENGRNIKEHINDSKLTKLNPDWTYNIGETIIGIRSARLNTFDIAIIVLSEKNFFCFHNHCTNVKYSKKLDYNPLDFYTYIIEPDGRLIVLIITDASHLMVYENTKLLWSAQLPFTAIAIARENMNNLDGAIIILSETGRLEVCYLGSELSLFIAPPMYKRLLSIETMKTQLINLRKIVTNIASDELDTSSQPELIIDIKTIKHTNSESEIGKISDAIKTSDVISKILIEFSSYTLLKNLQIYLQLVQPFNTPNDYYSFDSMNKQCSIELPVFINGDEIPWTTELQIAATYELYEDNLRFIKKSIKVPLKNALQSCLPENTTFFSVTFEVKGPSINYKKLFSETILDMNKNLSNTFGLSFINSMNNITVVCDPNKNKYRIGSNNALWMTTLVEQLSYNFKLHNFVGKTHTPNIKYVQLIQSHAESYSIVTQELNELKNEIKLLSCQSRKIAKSVLQCMQGRNPTSYATSDIEILMVSTCELMQNKLNEVQRIETKKQKIRNELQCALQLLTLMLGYNLPNDKGQELKSAINFEPQLSIETDWEVLLSTNLTALLHVKPTRAKKKFFKPDQNHFQFSQILSELINKIFQQTFSENNVCDEKTLPRLDILFE